MSSWWPNSSVVDIIREVAAIPYGRASDRRGETILRERRGTCIEWKVSASQPTTCRFTVHFKHAPDFSNVVSFEAVTPSSYCPDKIAGSWYTLPMGVASRSGDASVETGAAPTSMAFAAGDHVLARAGSLE